MTPTTPSTTERTCSNCAHRNHQPEAPNEPDCWFLLDTVQDVLRCDGHRTAMEDAADIAAHAAIRKAKGAAK